MSIKRLVLFAAIIIALSSGCTVKEKGGGNKEASGPSAERPEYSYFTLFSDGYSIVDNDMKIVRSTSIDDSISSYMINEERISLSGKRIYDVSLKTGNLLSSEPNTLNAGFVSIKNGYAEITGRSIVFNEKSRQFILFSSADPLTEVWRNPAHNYIYASDSLGYLYAIDFEKRILRKRLYAGRIKQLCFGNNGSRIFIVSDKSLLVLDFETLNIIYEAKGEYAAVYPFNRGNVFYLLSEDSSSIDIISSRKYKSIKRMKISSGCSSIVTDRDSLLFFFDSGSGIGYVMENGKKRNSIRLSSLSGMTPLLFHSGRVFFASDTSLARYDIKNDSIAAVSTGKKRPLFVYPYAKKVQQKSNQTQEAAKKTEDSIEKQGPAKTSDEVFFTVQMMSFKDKSGAEAYRDKLKKEYSGAAVFLEDTEINGTEYTRVCIGKFKTKAEAENLAETLKRRGGYKDLIIKKI